MKKKFTLISCIALIALLLCACGQKAAEKQVEDIIKSATGQDVDIKNDGSSITIKGQDGESMTFNTGDQAWPAGKMGDLPELAGKVTSFIEASGSAIMMINGVSDADAKGYIQKLKDLGYSDGYENTDKDAGSFSFGGVKDGYRVSFEFFAEGGDGPNISQVMLSYSKEN